MLSTLPKLADKAFILGFFMPVLLAVVAALWLFSDVAPIDKLVNGLSKKDTLEQLTYLLLSVWALAILLQLVNLVLFQVLEGYRWPVSAMRGMKSREMRRFSKMKQRFDEINQEQKDAERYRLQLPAEKEAELYDLRFKLVTQFPSSPDLLPTRFGNAIRAFEAYSGQMYGADAIPVWMRLATVVPKDFQQVIEDARAQVNFLVNLGFLVLVLVAFVIDSAVIH